MHCGRILPLLVVAAGAAAQCSLTTTFATNNGAAGNMFDIVATNGVSIDGFDVHLQVGTWDVEVYAVTAGGSYQGNESNPSAWTVVGIATGIESNGLGVPTPLPPILATPIAASATQGFYVTTSNGSGIRYTSGTSVGNTFAADNNIAVLEGSAVAYPFGFQFTPRVVNANVHYSGGSCAFTTGYGVGCPASNPPTLSAQTPPAIGTTMVAATTQIPTTAVWGVTIFGLTEFVQPILGATAGCNRLCSRIAVTTINLTNGEALLPLPASPFWIGTQLCGQSFLLDPTIPTPAPIAVSNGLRIIIGT